MTDVTIGYGSQFWLANSLGVLTKLGEILSVPLPNPQTAEVEATHMESPNRRREYIAGLIEDGQATFDINYVPGSETDELIREAQNSGDQRAYRVVVPTDDPEEPWWIEGTCVVIGYERTVPIDDRMTATVTVRFSGESTEEAGS